MHAGIAVDTERGSARAGDPRCRLAGRGRPRARRSAASAEAARGGTLSPDEATGATISVSNTGSYGSEAGTPLLNPPNAVTIALGVIEPRALVTGGGAVEARPACTISLTFDHRVLDGAAAGRALTDLVASPRGRRRSPRAAAITLPAMKVVSLLPSATEIVFALGLGDSLVGVTDECDFPPEAVTKPVVSRSALPQGRPLSAREIDQAVRGKLDAKQPLYVLDTDLLRREQPDVVLTQDLCRVCAVPSGQVQQALDKIGLPDAKVLSLDPNTLEEVIAQIDVVGKLLERADEAAKLTESLRLRVAKVKEVGDPPPDPERVLPRMVRSALRGRPLGAGDGRGGRRRQPALGEGRSLARRHAPRDP